MIVSTTSVLARLRRRIAPGVLTARLLGMRRAPDDGNDYPRALVLVQIDGLSRQRLHEALRAGRMPTLARLLRREGYQDHALYSGLPSSTPSVQAELFYGIRCAVPAFAWRERADGRVHRMYDPSSAAAVERDLSQRIGTAPALLEGGSAWCDIYTGGADEAHFCSASMGPAEILRRSRPLPRALALLLHLPALSSSLLRGGVEALRGAAHALGGAAAGYGAFAEFKFIVARVAVGVWLRDLITAGAVIDIARGLPVVHLNYLGYDEHAHRRGPHSEFALGTLKGIDRSIARLHRASRRAEHRHYELWVYSDHGQQATLHYERLVGSSLQAVLERAVLAESSGTDAMPRAIGLGPVAHVYLAAGDHADQAQLSRIAARLVERHQVPAVLLADPAGNVRAWRRGAMAELPDGVATLLGAEHPALQQIGADLVALARHEDAGDLVLLGWADGATAVSFAPEYGAHAGTGPEETDAFALLPDDAPLRHVRSAVADGGERGSIPLRPIDLRRAALAVLGRSEGETEEGVASTANGARRRADHERRALRIMTYNVHGCVGTDGRLSLERIVRVIAREAPDVVALQELDVGRDRSDRRDQAATIARLLEHDHRFHSTLQIEEEAYGDAILTRLPILDHHEAILGSDAQRQGVEPRGAVRVTLEWLGRPVHVINTHLGMFERERQAQLDALLQESWLGDPATRGPTVLCGDFNAVPNSRTMKRLRSTFTDAQERCIGVPIMNTFPAPRAMLRIDHVLIDGFAEVPRVRVPATALERVASDHLPLVVDLT